MTHRVVDVSASNHFRLPVARPLSHARRWLYETARTRLSDKIRTNVTSSRRQSEF